MRKIIFISSLVILIFGCSKKDEVIYILPKNYTGYIVVLYSQKDGVEPKYEGGKRVYEIPSSGILKTKFEADYGWSGFPKFYYGNMMDGNEILYKYDFEKVPVDSVVSFGGTNGTANRDLAGTSVVNFTNYYIGNKEQIEKAIEKASSIDYVKLADNRR